MARIADSVNFEPISFADLPGWSKDDHQAAFMAFVASAGSILAAEQETAAGMKEAAGAALALQRSEPVTREIAKSFFEARFTPQRLEGNSVSGLLTGYYEPELAGSTARSDEFPVPVIGRPSDLLNIVDESQRGARPNRLTHARRSPDTGALEPYFTRQEIETGALEGRGLDIAYVADWVDLFFMQVQGSGLIRFPDGNAIRLTYAGKNGHPYTSIGRHLIDTGVFTPESMNLAALSAWLKSNPERARPLLWRNLSYVFFRILGSETETSTLGTNEISLVQLRSLAVDTTFHQLGMPVYVSSRSLCHVDGNSEGFHRLMVAHDVGSAINGPERGDLFCGSGDNAGAIAGMTKHPVRFFPLVPNEVLEG